MSVFSMFCFVSSINFLNIRALRSMSPSHYCIPINLNLTIFTYSPWLCLFDFLERSMDRNLRKVLSGLLKSCHSFVLNYLLISSIFALSGSLSDVSTALTIRLNSYNGVLLNGRLASSS